MKRRIPTLIIVLMTVMFGLVLSVPAFAQDGGNSGAAQACQHEGWLDLRRADGTAFRNQGSCVSYAAQGGALVTPAQAYLEGVEIGFLETHHQSVHTTITATKYVNGNSQQIELHIVYDYAYVPGERHIDATVTLDSADAVQVSSDLSQASLNTTVNVQQRRIDCDLTNGDRVCSPEVVENVPVDIHVQLVANEPYQMQGDLFTRRADVSGVVTISDRVYQLEMGHGLAYGGHVFADQYPAGG